MAKPINLYQGPAPAAMGMMGHGILEAGANIGRTIQSGYESMGKSLGEGIKSAGSAVAGAYGDYKKMQSSIKASEKGYDTFKGFLDPEVRKGIDTKIEAINNDTSLSLQDKAAFWEQAKGMFGGAVNQGFAMQKQQKELDANVALQKVRDDAAKERALIDAQVRAEEFGSKPSAAGSGAVMPGAPFYDQGLNPAQQQPQSSVKSSLRKRHFGG